MHRNLAFLLAYDGKGFLGWQDNGQGSSIEESLKSVLEQILQSTVQLQAASRTDKGVHAEGQVVNCVVEHKDLKLSSLHQSMNALLPPSIAVMKLWEAPLHFHPTLDCTGKEYHYHLSLSPVHNPLLRHSSWHCGETLDVEAMRQAAQKLVGTHDFRALCNQRKGLNYEHFVRTIHRIDLLECVQEQLRIEIEGNRFLYKMVRNIVGTLVDLGKGKLPFNAIEQLLESGERPQAGVTAPAHGLVLKRVFYPSC